MLRIVRSKSRPLLHLMRCWSLVAPHLVEVGVGEKMGTCARGGKAEKTGESLKDPQHCQIWLHSCWGIVYTVTYIVIPPQIAEMGRSRDSVLDFCNMILPVCLW